MTQNPNPNQPLQTALDHAHTLAGSRQTQNTTPHWVAQAGHVGDLSVLALALRS
jgi:hypothetical protein